MAFATPACLVLLAMTSPAAHPAAGPWTQRLADLQRECDGGKLESCVLLGRIYNLGEAVAQDEDRASQLWTKACEKGSDNACFWEGDLTYHRGLQQGMKGYLQHGSAQSTDLDAVEKAAQAAAERYYVRFMEIAARNCEQGAASACAAHARWLTDPPVAGLARDPARGQAAKQRAFDLSQKACTAGDRPACALLRDFWLHDLDHKDWTRAVEQMKTACATGDLAACGEWAAWNDRAWMRQKSSALGEVEILGHYRKACDAGTPYFCEQAAKVLTRGRGVPSDRKEALRLYEKVWFDTGEAPEALLDLVATGTAADPQATLHFCEKTCTETGEHCECLPALRQSKK